MESLPQAVSLARALLTLARAERTGVLHIASESGQCRLIIVDGIPRAALGELGQGPSLGDVLLASGDLDAAAHARSLADGAEAKEGRVGEWLVARGLASRGAVERALRRQLAARLCAVLACRGLDYRFVDGQPPADAALLREPVATADLVLAAMRELVAARPLAELVRAVGQGPLGLTGLGRALLTRATLWPDEAAAASALSAGAGLREVLEASRGSERAVRALSTWCLLGAVRPLGRASDGRYSLLVRKRRQLREASSSRELLELGVGARPADARRALRALASRLHPDALGPDEVPELRRVSNEVLGALIEAERSVSGRGSRAP